MDDSSTSTVLASSSASASSEQSQNNDNEKKRFYPPELEDDYKERLGSKCVFYLREKKRFCRMLVGNGGHPVCPQHQEILEVKPKSNDSDDDNDGSGDQSQPDRNSRVPCPLDNGHTVKLRLLHKHLNVCNARKVGPDPPYYEENINATTTTTDKSPIGKTVKELTDEELTNLVQKINSVYEANIPQIKETTYIPIPSLLKLEAEATEEENLGKEGKRHFRQVISILNILHQENLIQPKTLFIEFGSGRGKLTFWLGKILMTDPQSELSRTSKFILIDRKSPRHKKDNKLAEILDINRVRIDIKDLKICGVSDNIKDYNIVGFSKHFCGSATDMGLRCLLEFNELRDNVKGIVFASCCHHLCDNETFIGTKSLENWGFSGEEFRALSCITSWYVCGTGTEAFDSLAEKKDESNQRFIQLGLNLEKRREIGYKAKRILDHARTEYISTYGLEAHCQSYCTAEDTFENTALIAKRLPQLSSKSEEEEQKNVNGQKVNLKV